MIRLSDRLLDAWVINKMNYVSVCKSTGRGSQEHSILHVMTTKMFRFSVVYCSYCMKLRLHSPSLLPYKGNHPLVYSSHVTS